MWTGFQKPKRLTCETMTERYGHFSAQPFERGFGTTIGNSLRRVLRGATPPDWRTSMYYRYYHDPGDHNTRAHYGVRTRTHKLIHFWKKDQWELFDLASDPYELHNLYGEPGVETLTASLKVELARVKRQVRDDNQLADVQLPNGVDGTVARLRGKPPG